MIAFCVLLVTVMEDQPLTMIGRCVLFISHSYIIYCSVRQQCHRYYKYVIFYMNNIPTGLR